MQKIHEKKTRKSRIKRYSRQIRLYSQKHIYKHAESIDKQKWQTIVGYLSMLPVLGVTFLLTLGLQHLVPNLVLADGILVLAIAITSLWWGWGPALFLTFLGMLLLDYFIITPSGEWTLIKWPAALQLLPFCLTGITIGILSRLRDKGWITARVHTRELAATNQKLEDEVQLKDRFLSMTSHELKTPITSIRMQAQLLQRRLKKGPATKDNNSTLQALTKIDERTHVLAEMIDELLDLSRTQRHQAAWKRQLLDINTLCREVVEDQQLVTGRSILFQGLATPAMVWGDTHRLAQVVSNLVGNAAKYSPAPSLIEVSVERAAQHVIIQVRDHGPGIEQDQLKHIFEPFYRTQEAQASTTGGLGLGLTITRQIVDFHEGHIWCESEKGHGSAFFVALPLTSQAEAALLSQEKNETQSGVLA